ncbi:MAG: TonB-dependent receptor [Bacteroidota bacterium]
MRYKINDNFGLKGAATFHHQFVSQNSLSPFQNTDQFYWVLSDIEILPVQKSTHFILGANYGSGNWTFDVEYYRKNTTGIVENQFLNIPPGVIRVLDFQNVNLSGENTAEGMDLFIKYRNKRFSSWLSYSLSSSRNQFWYINENTTYPSRQDQRHEINLTTILKLGRWELSSLFLFGSGKPFTPPNIVSTQSLDTVAVDGSNIYDLTRINGDRLPAYHRLDVSAKYSFPLGKTDCEAGITLFNLFNRRNIKSRRYTVQYVFDENSADVNATDEARIVALDTPLLGFTPNFFVNIRF